MRLTEHFDLEEFTASQIADRQGIDNTPPAAAVEALRALCTNVLEPLHAALGAVLVSSGYRCPALNTAIGGSASSQHVRGEAADLIVSGRTIAEVFNWLQVHAPYDQLIREFPPKGWVHVSFVTAGRRSCLLAVSESGRTVYRAQEGPVSA